MVHLTKWYNSLEIYIKAERKFTLDTIFRSSAFHGMQKSMSTKTLYISIYNDCAICFEILIWVHNIYFTNVDN